jgi:hypothetical protein
MNADVAEDLTISLVGHVLFGCFVSAVFSKLDLFLSFIFLSFFGSLLESLLLELLPEFEFSKEL